MSAMPGQDDGAMIQLRDRDILFSGTKRDCYEHPDDPSRLIKVVRDDARADLLRARQTKLRRKLLPAAYMDEQRREIRAYRQIQRRLGARAWRHIPEYLGTVPTDRGLGIVVRFLRSADGAPGVNLTRLLPDGYDPAVKTAVAEKLDFIRTERLNPRDLIPSNTVITHDGTGVVRAWFVDGFGSAEFLPLSRLIGSVALRQTEKRITRYERKLAALLQE